MGGLSILIIASIALGWSLAVPRHLSAPGIAMAAGQAAGVVMGAYHYARPDLNPDAKTEALWFLSVAGAYLIPGHLRPALDVETGLGLGEAGLAVWIRTGWKPSVPEAGSSPSSTRRATSRGNSMLRSRP